VGRISLAILSLAVAGVMSLSEGEALANHVNCGDTISADTTLHSDLVNCPNHGIVIGADDITLDLNGHTIASDGKPSCPEDDFCDSGVLNDGHDGVTVKDGSVRQFAFGAFVGRARHNRVLRISSSKNVLFGFVVAESGRSVVRDSRGNGNLAPDGDGMGLFGSHHVRIVDNSFRRNPLGLHVEDSTDNSIRRNGFSRNDGSIFIQGDRNQVRRNRCVRNGACIFVGPGNRNVIARNRVSRGVGGVLIEKGRGNVVARNVVVQTSRAGITLGIQNPSIGGSNNVVRRNRVRGSGDGLKIHEKDDHSVVKRNLVIGAKDDCIVSRGKHTVLKRNVVRGAGEDGVLVKSIAKRTLLRRNRSFGARDDGIDVGSPRTKLRRNLAARNGDLGIEAVRGVTDGGHNRAHGNGDPRQCTHVVCS
jgi:parallel beta-helix repeat protein